MKPIERFVYGLILALAFGFIGLALGTWIGSTFLMDGNSGLAGPAIALSYGLIGAVLFAIVAVLFAWRMQPPWLGRLAIGSAIVAMLLFVALLLLAKNDVLPSASGSPAPGASTGPALPIE